MTDIFKVAGLCRLTRDAELKYLQNGTAVSNFSVAVNEAVKKGDNWVDEASFFDFVLWGKTAENLNQYLKKGTQIAVEARPKQERWEKDGQKHSKVVFKVEQIELIGGKKSETAETENIPF